MKNLMLALVVLISAVSIGWAIHQPKNAVTPEEESGSSEIVLQVFSEAEYSPYESVLTDFSSLSSVQMVNVLNTNLVMRVSGISSATSNPIIIDYVASECGDCNVIIGKNVYDGIISPAGYCWRCNVTNAPSCSLGDLIAMCM